MLLEAVRATPQVVIAGELVALADRQDLLESSRRRILSDRALNGTAKEIARRFAQDLGRVCPLIRSVALSGSVASGGYDSNDDIDFNLIVIDGSKYIVYAMALILGLRATLRHRKVVGLRKLICINVLWTEQQCRPFERQDASLAFELLRSRPLVGAEYFRQVLSWNPWIDSFFPQIRGAPASSTTIPSPGRLGRLLERLQRHPRWLRAFNESARIATRAVYGLAHWLRRKDLRAMERLRFLQRVKYPYEVFQD